MLAEVKLPDETLAAKALVTDSAMPADWRPETRLVR